MKSEGQRESRDLTFPAFAVFCQPPFQRVLVLLRGFCRTVYKNNNNEFE